MSTLFEYPVEVSENELQSGYQHLNHADALRYLEQARVAFLVARGIPLELLMEKGIYLVIASIQVQYKREIYAGPLLITVEKPRVEGVSLLLNQKIYRVDTVKGIKKVAVEAVVESQCLVKEKRRAVIPPEELLEAFKHE